MEANSENGRQTKQKKHKWKSNVIAQQQKGFVLAWMARELLENIIKAFSPNFLHLIMTLAQYLTVQKIWRGGYGFVFLPLSIKYIWLWFNSKKSIVNTSLFLKVSIIIN